jgi:O-methyltransferase
MAATWSQRLKVRALKAARRMAALRGYEIVAVDQMPPDYDPATVALFEKVKPYTLTSHERVSALRQAVTYVVKAAIPGAIVECGVWRGGSMLAIVHTLVELGETDRDLYLFDTFATMPPPGEHDVDVWGTHAATFFDAALALPGYAYLPQEEVRALLVAAGYPDHHLHFVKGMVEDTIPEHAPKTISLCRLDTDWYESTAHEMERLYPRISPGGVLLVDDYGHFLGSKRAVDEYIEKEKLALLLNRIDFTGRLIVVPPHRRAVGQEQD